MLSGIVFGKCIDVTVAAGKTVSYGSETVTACNVSVYGTLTLNGTTLKMEGTEANRAKIEVKLGGTMRITSGSNITTANANNYAFIVRTGSTFEMRDSYMSGCGYPVSPPNAELKGLFVQTDGAKIIGNRFEGNLKPLQITGANNEIVSDNRFLNNDENQDPLYLNDTENAIVSNNSFEDLKWVVFEATRDSQIKNNKFLGDQSGIMVKNEAQGPKLSENNVLENNEIGYKLDMYGTSNTISGGFIRGVLSIEPGANTNTFNGVDFSGSEATLNSQGTTGTAFDNNVFDGTQFTEDNAALRLGNNNSVKNTAFGKNITVSVEGAGNTIEGVTIADSAGITVSGGNIAAGGGNNVIRESSIALQLGKSITCDGFCRIENNVISEVSTGISSSAARKASFEALCPYTCSSGEPSFPLCQGTWQQESYPCLQTEQACWRCVQAGIGAPGTGQQGGAETPQVTATPVPPEQQYAKVVLNNGGVVSGNSIKPATGFAVSVKGRGAYLYNNDLGVVLFDGGSGVSEKNTLGSVEGRNGADYVLLNTILGDCSGDCGQNANIINDATSTAERQWWVAVRVTDANGNPLDGTFEMTSRATGKKYSGTVTKGLLAAPFNATEWVFGSTAGMTGSVLLFAGSGDYNPYHWEACSGDNCEEGDDSFTKETLLPIIIRMLASPTPSAPPQGGAPSI
ncbi:hypothetical protein COU36_05075, partial [Candidatus Micrarchaeota archaeon CG10_big_fil_rev_8_21_14_0_10_59_7]